MSKRSRYAEGAPHQPELDSCGHADMGDFKVGTHEWRCSWCGHVGVWKGGNWQAYSSIGCTKCKREPAIEFVACSDLCAKAYDWFKRGPVSSRSETGRQMSAIPTLLMQCKALKLPAPVLEHRFDKVRRWRFDAAWLEPKIAVEVDGGGFVAGRHSRGLGMEKDSEKYAAAILAGWKVFRTTPRQVLNGDTVKWIEQAFEQFHGGKGPRRA